MGRKTLKIPTEDYERHNERRQAIGLSWPEYIDRQAPAVETGVSESEARELVRDELRRFKEDLVSELRR